MPHIDTRTLSDPRPRWHDTKHDQADTYPVPRRSPLLPSEHDVGAPFLGAWHDVPGPESRPAAEMACHGEDVGDTNRRTERAFALKRDVAFALVVVAVCAGVALVPPGVWHAVARWFA